MPGDRIYSLQDFYFDLPDELIAKYPAEKRAGSRLFVLDRRGSSYRHRVFHEIAEYLREGDILVANNVRVIPARMFFRRRSGALVEIVLTRKFSGKRWLVICNRTKRLGKGETLSSDVNPAVEITVLSRVDDNLEIESNIELTDELLKEIGKIPLPPYIGREASPADYERYQTVYAREGAAAAAPTAGLHFSMDMIKALQDKGVIFTEVTLDVSWGTFQPVRVNDLAKHKMHTETFYLGDKAALIINNGRKNGSRIIAVGTTSLRLLESTYRDGQNISGSGETNIFIYPPYKIRSIDALITNFHTPYSTLLMLVSAFAGYDRIMDAYKTAIQERYRFFSYGDAMLIL